MASANSIFYFLLEMCCYNYATKFVIMHMCNWLGGMCHSNQRCVNRNSMVVCSKIVQYSMKSQICGETCSALYTNAEPLPLIVCGKITGGNPKNGLLYSDKQLLGRRTQIDVHIFIEVFQHQFITVAFRVPLVPQEGLTL